MGVHNLLSKVDRALVAYIVSNGAGVAEDVFTAKNPGDRERAPWTFCFADSATPSHPYSGEYQVKASIEVHTNASPDKDQDQDQMVTDAHDRVADTFDLFHVGDEQSGDTLADLLTAAAGAAGIDLTITDAEVVRIEQGVSDREGEWVDSLSLELTCTQ